MRATGLNPDEADCADCADDADDADCADDADDVDDADKGCEEVNDEGVACIGG